MKKLLLRLFLAIIIIFGVIWSISILKCEILTHCYGSQFEEIYRENTMFDDIDYLKVLNYSNKTARVYYVSKNGSGGDILIFINKNKRWEYKSWERTVWSKTGSADGFVWPYIR